MWIWHWLISVDLSMLRYRLTLNSWENKTFWWLIEFIDPNARPLVTLLNSRWCLDRKQIETAYALFGKFAAWIDETGECLRILFCSIHHAWDLLCFRSGWLFSSFVIHVSFVFLSFKKAAARTLLDILDSHRKNDASITNSPLSLETWVAKGKDHSCLRTQWNWITNYDELQSKKQTSKNMFSRSILNLHSRITFHCTFNGARTGSQVHPNIRITLQLHETSTKASSAWNSWNGARRRHGWLRVPWP